MVYYTIAEASEILSVSKVTIYNKLKALKKELKDHVRTKQGIKYIDTEGLEVIKVSMSGKVEGLNDLNNEEVAATAEALNFEGLNAFNKELKSLEKVIGILEKQLEEKDRQLERKDEQLKHNDKILENFQVLLREEQQNRLLLEERINQVKEEPKSFWDRLFNKS